MLRSNFIFSLLSFYPFSLLSQISELISSNNSADKGFKVNAGEARFGTHYKMKGVTLNNLDIKISTSDSDGKLAVFEQTGLTPNGGPPLHVHPYQDEWFFVLEGEYHFQVGDDKFNMKPGDTIFLPKNIPHAFIQLTDKAKTIVSYFPAGKMEDFFKVTDTWQSPPSKEDVAKAFSDHEMTVVGPPLSINK